MPNNHQSIPNPHLGRATPIHRLLRHSNRSDLNSTLEPLEDNLVVAFRELCILKDSAFNAGSAEQSLVRFETSITEVFCLASQLQGKICILLSVCNILSLATYRTVKELEHCLLVSLDWLALLFNQPRPQIFNLHLNQLKETFVKILTLTNKLRKDIRGMDSTDTPVPPGQPAAVPTTPPSILQLLKELHQEPPRAFYPDLFPFEMGVFAALRQGNLDRAGLRQLICGIHDRLCQVRGQLGSGNNAVAELRVLIIELERLTELQMQLVRQEEISSEDPLDRFWRTERQLVAMGEKLAEMRMRRAQNVEEEVDDEDADEALKASSEDAEVVAEETMAEQA